MINGKEVAEVIRKALRGEIAVRPVVKEVTWTKAWCGNVQFLFGDWLITIFNDCNHMDYIDFVIAPDGREAEYADWLNDNGDSTGDDPMDHLTPDELAAFETLLKEAV